MYGLWIVERITCKDGGLLPQSKYRPDLELNVCGVYETHWVIDLLGLTGPELQPRDMSPALLSLSMCVCVCVSGAHTHTSYSTAERTLVPWLHSNSRLRRDETVWINSPAQPCHLGDWSTDCVISPSDETLVCGSLCQLVCVVIGFHTGCGPCVNEGERWQCMSWTAHFFQPSLSFPLHLPRVWHAGPWSVCKLMPIRWHCRGRSKGSCHWHTVFSLSLKLQREGVWGQCWLWMWMAVCKKLAILQTISEFGLF